MLRRYSWPAARYWRVKFSVRVTWRWRRRHHAIEFEW